MGERPHLRHHPAAARRLLTPPDTAAEGRYRRIYNGYLSGMLFAGRRLLAANLQLGEALAADDAATAGWADTDERVCWGYLGWIAEAWTPRGRRRRTTATLARARLGPLEFQHYRHWDVYPTPGI